MSIPHPKKQTLQSLSLLYLILPSVLFAIGWLRPLYAFFTIAILVCFIAIALKKMYDVGMPFGKISSSDWLLAVFVLLCLICWILLSGTGGFGFQNTDYRASNALLKDLIEQDWPIHLVINNVDEKYVYYMAYYLPAAAVGKSFGWEAANYFLVIWTLIGVLLSFLWFIRISRIRTDAKITRILLVLLVFCLAGGLDLFGAAYLRNDILKISNQNEWWAGYFQYSSNTTLIYWVPQQAIAIWLVMGLVVDSAFDFENFSYIGVAFFSGMMWSPLGMMGILPYIFLVLILNFSQKERMMHDWRFLLLNGLSLWIGIIYILYFASNQLKFPMTFSWSNVDDQGRLFKYILAFWFLEFGFLAFLVISFVIFATSFRRGKIVERRNPLINFKAWVDSVYSTFDVEYQQLYFLALSLGILFLLPLLKIGIYNDIVMRASIPSLFVFWAMVVKILFDANLRARLTWNFLYSLLIAVVLIGFYPSVMGISESVRKYHVGPVNLDTVQSSAAANSKDIVMQRIGSKESFFYLHIGK